MIIAQDRRAASSTASDDDSSGVEDADFFRPILKRSMSGREFSRVVQAQPKAQNGNVNSTKVKPASVDDSTIDSSDDFSTRRRSSSLEPQRPRPRTNIYSRSSVPWPSI